MQNITCSLIELLVDTDIDVDGNRVHTNMDFNSDNCETIVIIVFEQMDVMISELIFDV